MNVYEVIYQIVDETALYRAFEDCEGDIQAERFENYECEIDKDNIQILFTATSDKCEDIQEYWLNQREWTLIDVVSEEVVYLPIKLLSFVREPLELF